MKKGANEMCLDYKPRQWKTQFTAPQTSAEKTSSARPVIF